MSSKEIVEEETTEGGLNEITREEVTYYHRERQDGFFVKYKNMEVKDNINVWNFHKSPIFKRLEDGHADNGEPKYTYEPCTNIGQQFVVIESDQIINFQDCERMGANLSNKENVNLFEEITAPSMFFHNNFDKKKFFHIFSKFHHIPFFNHKKVDDMKKQCEEIRDQLIENKKKALIKLEKVIDEQIRLFETNVIGKLDKRKKLLNNVDVNQLEDKVKRGDVTLLSSEKTTPLTDIIMKCGDVLNIIFSFLYARELIKNFTPTCSMFLHMIHSMPLKIEIDERDLHLFEMQELLSEYKLQEIIIVYSPRSDRITNDHKGNNHNRDIQPFRDVKQLEDFSKILTTRKHQIRHLDVEYLVSLSFNQWKKPFIHKKGSFHFYDVINECGERLETLKTKRFIPKSMSKLTNLKKFIFHTPITLTKRDADSLIEFFSDSDGGRYNLTHLEILVETGNRNNNNNNLPQKNRKELLEDYRIRESILNRIPETCVNLKSLVLDLEFCFHTFELSLIEFIVTQVKDVSLIYGGFDGSLIYSNEIFELFRRNVYGGNFTDDEKKRRKEGVEKMNSILNKEVLISKRKMDLFHDLLMTKRKKIFKYDNQSFKIKSKTSSGNRILSKFLTGGGGGWNDNENIEEEEKSLYEFMFVFEIMKLPHIEHEFEFYSWQGTRLDDFIEIMSLKEFEGSDIHSKSLSFKNLFYENYKEIHTWVGQSGTWMTGGWNNNNTEEERKKQQEKSKKEIEKFNTSSIQFRKCLEDMFSRSIFLEKLQISFVLILSEMREEIDLRNSLNDNVIAGGEGGGGWGGGNYNQYMNHHNQVMNEEDVPIMKEYSFLIPNLMKSLINNNNNNNNNKNKESSKLKVLEVEVELRNIRNHFNILKVTISEIFNSLELILMNNIFSVDNNFEMLKISIHENDHMSPKTNVNDDIELVKRKGKDLNEFFKKLCLEFVDSQNNNILGDDDKGIIWKRFKLLIDIKISEKWEINLGVVDNMFCVKKMDLVVYEDDEKE